MSEKVRDELLRMNSNERRDERCVISKRLYASAKKLTKKQSDKIDQIALKIKVLDGEKAQLYTEKEDIIKTARLTGVVSHIQNNRGCDMEDDHPELIEFDKESNKQRKEILLM